MPDPISLVAVGGAVGGLAGKFAEKSWETAASWLKERFGSHDAEVRDRARANAAGFVQRLAARVRVLEDREKMTSDRITASQTQPSFSVLLQTTVLGAAQTDDTVKHDLLAKLIADRLAVDAETTFALASQMAAEAIVRSTRRQLEILALVCFLEEIRPKKIESSEEYYEWLETWSSHFEDFEFEEIDARHLVAIGCITYEPSSERDLRFLLEMKAKGPVLLPSFKVPPSFQVNWDLGLSGVRLTSVGSIVGGLALDQITGKESGDPAWRSGEDLREKRRRRRQRSARGSAR